MRNFFAVDMTDPDNPTMSADGYCRRRVSDTLSQQMETLSDEMTENVEQATRSWPHKIAGFAVGAVALISIAAFDILAEGAETIPPTAWLCLIPVAICLVAGVLISRSYKKLVDDRMGTDEMTLQAQQAEAYYHLSRHEMGVPEDAAAVDILTYPYEMKKGKEKQLHVDDEHYHAMEMAAFVEDGYLMLAEADRTYGFSLAQVTAVTRLEGGTRIHCWNKEEGCKDEPYKPYRISYNEEDDVFTVRAVYVVEWPEGELVVPDYDWERILAPMTGLSTTATEKRVTFSLG